jgi:NAD(P)-dependent dehydrogenase (short-subunit alcohol dehydrogenase family)
MAYSPFDLTGKVALVTGGNGGIGLGMAEALAQAGASVGIWGSNADKNRTALERLRAHGGKVEAWQVNVADEAQVAASMLDVVARFGRIDSVFANAGIGGGAPSFQEFPTETWRRVLAVDLDGVFFTFREALKHMVERAKAGDPGGSLVGVSSMVSLFGAPRNEAYGAAKMGVISLCKSVAVEHARYGIRANAVLPGWIATDMTDRLQHNDKFTENAISRVPMRRWGEPHEFGGIAVYFASDASAFHTGDQILIDGGYTKY